MLLAYTVNLKIFRQNTDSICSAVNEENVEIGLDWCWIPTLNYYPSLPLQVAINVSEDRRLVRNLIVNNVTFLASKSLLACLDLQHFDQSSQKIPRAAADVHCLAPTSELIMDGFVFKCPRTEELLGVLDNNFSITTRGLHSSETINCEFEYIFNDLETA